MMESKNKLKICERIFENDVKTDLHFLIRCLKEVWSRFHSIKILKTVFVVFLEDIDIFKIVSSHRC